MSEILNKCPICGGKLEYNHLNQYANVYGINRNGVISERRKRKEDCGSMECGFIACVDCDFVTNCDLKCENYPEISIYQKGEVLFYINQNE